MSAEIISPFGVSASPLPDAELIERLETLLDAARSGRVTGMIYGTVRPNGEIGTGWAGEGISAHYFLAASAALQWRVAQGWVSNMEDGTP